MRTIGKLIALFNGSQMLLSGIGMAVFCYHSPGAFAKVSEQSGFDLRLVILTAGLIPQIGLGALLVWMGIPSRWRMQIWRFGKYLLEN